MNDGGGGGGKEGKKEEREGIFLMLFGLQVYYLIQGTLSVILESKKPSRLSK